MNSKAFSSDLNKENEIIVDPEIAAETLMLLYSDHKISSSSITNSLKYLENNIPSLKKSIENLNFNFKIYSELF